MRTITLILLFFAYTSSLLNNQNDMCTLMRDSLFQITSNIKEMNNSIRMDLSKYSFRGLTYEVLETASLSNQETNDEITALIKDIEERRLNYQNFKNLTQDELESSISELTTKVNELSKSIQENTDKQNNFGFKNNKTKEQIVLLVEELKSSDKEIYNHIELVKDFEMLTFILKSDDNISEMSLSMIAEMIPKFPKDKPELMSLVGNYQEVARDVLIARDYIKAESVINKALTIKKSKEFSSSFSLFVTHLKVLEKSVNKINLQLLDWFQVIMKSSKNEIKLKPKYVEYNNLIENLKKDISQKEELKFAIKGLETESSNLMKQIQMDYWKKWRIVKRDLQEFENISNSLEKVSAIKLENYNDQIFKDKEASKLLKEMYIKNSDRLNDLETLNISYMNQKDNLEEIFKKEERLDQIFGEIFAEIQDTGKQGNQAMKCFSSSELSAYFYYMSITQIIFIKSNFMDSFLRTMNEPQALKISKQFFIDIKEDGFSDPRMFYSKSSSFAENGIQIAATNFSLLMTEEIKNSLSFSPDSDEKGIFAYLYYSIMRCLGFTLKAVKTIVIGVSIALFFHVLAVGLITVLGITTIYGIAMTVLTGFVTGLLTFMVTRFYEWLSEFGSAADHAKKEFLKIISNIYSSIMNDNLNSLDYDQVLENVRITEYRRVREENKKPEEEDADRTEYYRNLFNSFRRLTEHQLKNTIKPTIKLI